MNGTDVLRALATPEVVGLLLTIVVALLLKSKVLTEKDIAAAKSLLRLAREDVEKVQSEITDRTGLTLPQVREIARDVKDQVEGGDSTRKKVQRAARAALRGWLKF